MTGLLIPVICLFSFLLCPTREAAAGAQTAGQMWVAARRAGWGHTSFITARIVVVVVLLILADVRRLAGHAVKAVRIFVEALAVHAEILGSLVTRTEVRA
jgi:acid phosphatase family membrane protein YuiD